MDSVDLRSDHKNVQSNLDLVKAWWKKKKLWNRGTWDFGWLVNWCLTPLSTVFQLHHGDSLDESKICRLGMG